MYLTIIILPLLVLFLFVFYGKRVGMAFLYTQLAVMIINYASRSIALNSLHCGKSPIMLHIVILLLLITISFAVLMAISILKNDCLPSYLEVCRSLILCLICFICHSLPTVSLLIGLIDSGFITATQMHISNEMYVELLYRRRLYTDQSRDCYNEIIARFPTVLNGAAFNINSIPDQFRDELRNKLHRLSGLEDLRKEAYSSMQLAGMRANYRRTRANDLLDSLGSRWVSI